MNNLQTVRYALMCLQELDNWHNRPCSPLGVSRRNGVPLEECVAVLEKLGTAGLIEVDDEGNYILRCPLGDLPAFDILTALAAPIPKVTRFKMRVGADHGLAARVTLRAIAWADSVGAYPSDNGAV